LSDEKVEFRWLDAELVGSDTVTFRLEDGAIVKIKVDIQQAGIAINYTNPDGTPHYSIGTGLRINVIPSNKKFYIPRSSLMVRKDRKTESQPSII